MDHTERLQVLKNNTDLYNRLKIFLYDLQNFSKERLDNSESPNNLYLSPIYFDKDEITQLLNFSDQNGISLETLLKNKIQDKIYVCTSHDLAPIIASVFQIPKDYSKEKSFRAYRVKFIKLWNVSRKAKHQ